MDVFSLGNLPLLRTLRVKGNPFTETPNYRTRILGQFGGRAGEVCLFLSPNFVCLYFVFYV